MSKEKREMMSLLDRGPVSNV